MRKHLVGDSGTEIVYQTKNTYTKEMRFVYFFADVPHLMKIVRNCLFHTGSGRGTKYMQNNDFFLLWPQIARIYYEDLESGLKLVNNRNRDHINLTSYSVMRVNLVAQVISKTVGNVLNNFGSEEAAGNEKFCLMMD